MQRIVTICNKTVIDKSVYVYLVPRWTQQLSPTLWLLFLLLYLCEILVLVIYLSEWEFHWKVSTWFV